MSGKKNKKKGGTSPSGIGDKSAHVQNLINKRNWTQIKKLASEGVQAAVEALQRRTKAQAQEKTAGTKS